MANLGSPRAEAHQSVAEPPASGALGLLPPEAPSPPTGELTTAPRAEPTLAGRLRARLRRALRPPRRAIPTVPGLFALIAPTFLGLAAVTATNNLLFLLLGATLGAIVLSGILSERNIRPVEVRIRPMGPAYASSPARLEVCFERSEPGDTVYDLRFREAPGLSFLPFRKALAPPEVLDVHLPILEGRSASVLGERIFRRRGRARLPLCEVSTRYPFGLLVKSRDVIPDIEVWVRPRLIARPPALARPPGVSGAGDAALRRGLGLDVYGLRERTDRDAAHRVHALRSLALGREVVLEMSGVERPIAEVGVATDLAAEPEALERALEIAQAALLGWAREGYAVGLATYSRSFSPGEVEVDALLDHLAEVVPQPGAPLGRGGPAAWLVPSGAAPPAGRQALLVTETGLSERLEEAAA